MTVPRTGSQVGKYRLSYDFPQTGTVATGLITCVTNANMTDGDFITVPTGIGKPVSYEYDKSANGVNAARISWAAGATSAADVAATLRTAILANQSELSVTDNLDGTLTIAHRWPGAGGINTITETVSNAGFTVAGLSGGVSPDGSTLADTTLKLDKIKVRAVRVDRVYLNLSTTLTANASSYCTFKLLKGASTVVATWSTNTTGNGGQGTITANTPVEMVMGTLAARGLAVGDELSWFIDVTGTPTVPPGRIVAEGVEL